MFQVIVVHCGINNLPCDSIEKQCHCEKKIKLVSDV